MALNHRRDEDGTLILDGCYLNDGWWCVVKVVGGKARSPAFIAGSKVGGAGASWKLPTLFGFCVEVKPSAGRCIALNAHNWHTLRAKWL